MVATEANGDRPPGDEKRRLWADPKLWLALLSFSIVLAIFGWDEGRTVPTPISAVHAQEVELLSSDDCTRCHGSASQTMAEACFDCHEEVGEQLQLATGFHGEAIESEASNCGECHIEHAGREFPLVGEHSFERAGFASRADFDHPFSDYDLRGAHDGLDCTECHENADLRLLPAGSRRFQGEPTECTACHDDSPHEGRMQRACELCHGQEQPFAEVATFVHDERFALEGVHQLEDCNACHTRGSDESIEALASLEALPPVRGCAACHDPLHLPEFLDAVAALVERPREDRCTHCHLEDHGEFVTARAELSSTLHVASGFPLTGPHDDLECAECHEPQEDWQGRFPGRLERECAACHEDPHQAQFVGNERFRACIDCHLIDRFEPAHFDREEHEQTGFPLDGSHRGVGCYACHPLVEEGGKARLWKGIDSSCSSCHEDAHGGHFEARALVLGEPPPADCADCHEPTAFADASSSFKAQHRRWTDFPLEGSHETAECSACHRAAPRTDELGRRFGRIAEVWGEAPTPKRPCASCHGDPHTVDFDLAQRPEEVSGRRGCARCHDAVAFEQQPYGMFDHGVWTDRSLGGMHLDLECHECHVPSAVPDENGRKFGRVREVFGEEVERCATCHADPHLGLFDSSHAPSMFGENIGCARCHTEHDFVRLIQTEFDHDLWTDTDFASEHTAQNCDDCHPRLDTPGAAGRGRRMALGRSCDACHSDIHIGQFRTADGVDCRSCHEDQSSWTELVFDHQEDSRYPLDDIHEDLECADCHVAYPQLGGKPVVRYKPLGVECIDCHSTGDSSGGGQH